MGRLGEASCRAYDAIGFGQRHAATSSLNVLHSIQIRDSHRLSRRGGAERNGAGTVYQTGHYF